MRYEFVSGAIGHEFVGQRGRLEKLTPPRMVQNYIFEIIRAIKNTILIFTSFTINKISKQKNQTSAFVNFNSTKLFPTIKDNFALSMQYL